MKRPILFAFVLLASMVSVFDVSRSLVAAELWNVQGNNADDGGEVTYYNRQGATRSGGEATLYNVQKKMMNKKSYLYGKKNETVRTYGSALKRVEMRKAKPSKLWAFMSADAKYNKEADTEVALKNEYKNRVNSAKHLIKVRRKYDQFVKKARVRQQKEAEARLDKKIAIIKERQRKKDIALGKVKGGKVAYSTGAPKSGNKLYNTTRPKKIYADRDVIKKPVRLFNDPNK